MDSLEHMYGPGRVPTTYGAILKDWECMPDDDQEMGEDVQQWLANALGLTNGFISFGFWAITALPKLISQLLGGGPLMQGAGT